MKINMNNLLFFVFGIVIGLLIFYIFSFQNMSSDCLVTFEAYPSSDDTVVDMINSAQDYVYVEMYVFTNKRIMEALADADNRGVDVRVILENSIDINQDAYLYLKSHGVETRWASKNYRITHAKLMLIDGKKVFIGSPNFSWSAFHKNREFAAIIMCNDDRLLPEFFNDWKMAG